MTRELAVLLGGHVVARVERTRAGALRLTYTGEGDGTPLSLSLPRGVTTYAGAPVTTFLDALLPENPGVRASMGRAHRADENDLLDLLAAVGKPPHQTARSVWTAVASAPIFPRAVQNYSCYQHAQMNAEISACAFRWTRSFARDTVESMNQIDQQTNGLLKC